MYLFISSLVFVLVCKKQIRQLQLKTINKSPKKLASAKVEAENESEHETETETKLKRKTNHLMALAFNNSLWLFSKQDPEQRAAFGPAANESTKPQAVSAEWADKNV